MLRLLSGMCLGYILFTDKGKKMTNKIVNVTINRVKKNIVNSDQFKELVSLKDIFIKDEANDSKEK